MSKKSKTQEYLEVGDRVVSRVSGNPYCKDRVMGLLTKVGSIFARIKTDDGFEVVVRREWIQWVDGLANYKEFLRKEKDARNITETKGKDIG